MKKKTLTVSLLAVLLTLSFVALPVYALGGEGSAERAAQVQARLAEKTANLAAKCTTFTAKIDNHLTKISAQITKQNTQNQKHDNRIKALIDRAKALGVDTTKAEADWLVWSGKTAEITAARQEVVSELTALKGLQCVDQKDQFATTLRGVKTKLAHIHTLQQEKNAYFKNTIKPDLQAIRAQLEK